MGGPVASRSERTSGTGVNYSRERQRTVRIMRFRVLRKRERLRATTCTLNKMVSRCVESRETICMCVYVHTPYIPFCRDANEFRFAFRNSINSLFVRIAWQKGGERKIERERASVPEVPKRGGGKGKSRRDLDEPDGGSVVSRVRKNEIRREKRETIGGWVQE